MFLKTMPPVSTARNFLRPKQLAITSLFAILCIVAVGCSTHPVEEIVTTDASRVSAIPPGAEPVTKEANLPDRDPDLEEAGDRIGEAITYLDSHRRDKWDAAGRALNDAQNSLTKIQREGLWEGADLAKIEGLLKELDSSMRAVSHNSPDAAKHLTELSKRLDNLELAPARAKDAESK
jgi:hypothetical protein